jgi:hypothetical protein
VCSGGNCSEHKHRHVKHIDFVVLAVAIATLQSLSPMYFTLTACVLDKSLTNKSYKHTHARNTAASIGALNVTTTSTARATYICDAHITHDSSKVAP